MEKKYEIGGFVRSFQDMTSNAMFVMTRKDILNLQEEIREWADVTNHPEIFFRFENYPVVIALPTIEKAKWLVEKATHWYSNYPDGQKFWVSVKEIKS